MENEFVVGAEEVVSGLNECRGTPWEIPLVAQHLVSG